MDNLAMPYALHPTRGNIPPDDEQDGVGRRANVSCLGCGESLEHRRAELGFKQSNPQKPWLFLYEVHRRNPSIKLYADLGGSDVVPIYEDTAAMLYVFGIDDEDIYDYHGEDTEISHGIAGIAQYLIASAGERLQHFGVDVRTGFLSPHDVDRRDVNLVRHVNPRMLSDLVNQVEPERRRIETEVKRPIEEKRRALEARRAEAERQRAEEYRLEREWWANWRREYQIRVANEDTPSQCQDYNQAEGHDT